MSDLDLRVVREDDALLDALGRGGPAPEEDRVAQLLSGWRIALAADTEALRPVPARARGDRRPSVWLATPAAALLMLAGLTVLTGAPARWLPGVVNVVDPTGTTTPTAPVRSSPAPHPAAPVPSRSWPAAVSSPPSPSQQPSQTDANGALSVPLPIPVRIVPDLPPPPPQLSGPPPRALPRAPR
jgi:hypothetical protein